MSSTVILLDVSNAQALEGRLQRSCSACRWEAQCQHEFRVRGAQTQGKSFFQHSSYNSTDRNTARRGTYLPPCFQANGIFLVTQCGSWVNPLQAPKVNYKAIFTYKKWDISCFQGFMSFWPPFHSSFLDISFYFTKAKIF